MTETRKLLAALKLVEDDLTRHLLECLPEATVTGRDLFTNSEFNPHGLIHLDPDAEACLRLAREAMRLREELQLPGDSSPAQVYLDACHESADLSNHHRLGPRRLAERVLGALRRI